MYSKIFTTGLALVFGLTLFTSSVKAAELTITCNGATCDSSPLQGPIFNETNVLPLDSYQRSLEIINTDSGSPINIDLSMISGTFSDSTPSLADILTVYIYDQDTSELLYGPKS